MMVVAAEAVDSRMSDDDDDKNNTMTMIMTIITIIRFNKFGV